MYFKKVIASATAAITLISALSFGGIESAFQNDTPVKGSGASGAEPVSFAGNDSLGRYISRYASQNRTKGRQLSAAAATQSYVITGLKFSPDKLTAYADSSQSTKCRLRVTITDEADGRICTEKDILVSEGSDIISEVNFKGTELPEYYYVSAVLVDIFGTVLTNPFRISDYTREMQEIYATKATDFEEDKVVNFDEKNNTNFMVLKDDTVMSESSSEINTIVSADYDNGVFVFENPDETLLNVQEGQNLYVIDDEKNSIAVNVQSIDVEDDVVTVKGSDDNYDEMFEFIKIETEASPENADYEPAEAEGLEILDVKEIPSLTNGHL